MSHPPCGLTAGATFAAGIGVLLSADATFAGGTAGTAVLKSDGGAGEVATGGTAAATGAAAGGDTGGCEPAKGAPDRGVAVNGGSLLTVAMVVMVAVLATAGAGVSCRLSEGNGDS